jgi:hypothetical protein
MAEKQGSEDIKLESVFSQNFEPEDERKLVRKLDGRIMVILSILYLFACKSSLRCIVDKILMIVCVDLDRSNLGNARLLGLPKVLSRPYISWQSRFTIYQGHSQWRSNGQTL